MSKFKKEYSILPQNEGDDFQQHIRTTEPSRPCFLVPLIAVTIILILSGVVTLSLSLFFPQTFSQVVHWSRPPHSVTNEKDGDNFWSSTTLSSNEGKSSTTAPHKSQDVHDDTDSDNFSPDLSLEHGGNSSSTEYYNDDSKEDGNNSSSSGGTSNNHDNVKGDSSSGTPSTTANSIAPHSDKKPKNSSWLTTEDFEELARKVEHNLESMTGIRKPELVIPLFMLICFMTSLTVVSLCCCIMMRRKDNRRRKMFGKIITDLQTGDSKTVLLNQDMDD